jgi:hypothetical protein
MRDIESRSVTKKVADATITANRVTARHRLMVRKYITCAMRDFAGIEGSGFSGDDRLGAQIVQPRRRTVYPDFR